MSTKVILTSFTEDELKSLIRECIREIILLPSIEKAPKVSENLLNPTEVVKLLRISKVTLQKWMKTGKVPYYRLGRKVYFRESELLDTINLRKNRV